MKFTVAGNKIICSRIDQTVENAENYRDVVAFDSHVESVPPHVAAKLTKGEIEDLDRFIADRRRLKADPVEINMLEALPELMAEVVDVLNSANRLNEDLYNKLTASAVRLTEALRRVRPRDHRKVTQIDEMRSTEVLKERLEIIKRDL